MATATATMNNGMMTMPANSGAVSAPAPAPKGSTALTTPTGTQDANVPGTGLSPWQTLGMAETFTKVLNQPSVRRILPLIVMLAVMVLFGLTYAWMSTTPYRPVMPGLQEADQQAAFESLKTSDFKPKIDPATGQLKIGRAHV